jgi:hypothetical protein
MRIDRRRVVGSLSLLLLTGCLGEPSLSIPFDLRIQNRDSRPRRLSVVVDHVTEGEVYDETRQLAAGEEITESAVATAPGRYRIRANDITTDAERTAERNVELTTGAGFCGWFVVRAESESVIATVPRCPDTESTNNT